MTITFDKIEKESSYHSWYITSKTMQEASGMLCYVDGAHSWELDPGDKKGKVLHLVNFSSLNEY